MGKIYSGISGNLHISDPEIFVDNQAGKRSGHMSHAMLEYAPGEIIAFNSNCSALRYSGHSAFGWIEYRYSGDYGRTWGKSFDLQCTIDELLDGCWTNSVEKAVCCNGVITVFLLRNSQSTGLCCMPWGHPMYIQSYDCGKTWTAPCEFSPYDGRIYDAAVHDDTIYVLQFCNPDHVGRTAENVYRLYSSSDNGKSFKESGRRGRKSTLCTGFWNSSDTQQANSQ